MEMLTPSESKDIKTTTNDERIIEAPSKRASLRDPSKPIKTEKGEGYLPPIGKELSQKIQSVSVIPSNQRGILMSQKAKNPLQSTANKEKGKRRIRPPKTQFKIVKSNANIEKLEGVLVDFIDKNKVLRSSNEEIIMRPQNRMQAAINSLRAVNKILPKSNLVKHTFGYDEANLSKNHLILEKVMLERITKIKLRRQEEKLAREQSEAANNPKKSEA